MTTGACYAPAVCVTATVTGPAAGLAGCPLIPPVSKTEPSAAEMHSDRRRNQVADPAQPWQTGLRFEPHPPGQPANQPGVPAWFLCGGCATRVGMCSHVRSTEYVGSGGVRSTEYGTHESTEYILRRQVLLRRACRTPQPERYSLSAPPRTEEECISTYTHTPHRYGGEIKNRRPCSRAACRKPAPNTICARCAYVCVCDIQLLSVRRTPQAGTSDSQAPVCCIRTYFAREITGVQW